MRRELRRFLGRILPERAKRGFRGRLFGDSRPPDPFDLSISIDDDVATAKIGGYFDVRLPRAALEDFKYHLAENADTVEETRFLLEQAGRCAVLFDVGAHRGLLSTLFCLANPSAKAMAFEPSSTLVHDADQMRQLNSLGGRLVLRPVALGAKQGAISGVIGPEGMLHPLDASVTASAESFDLSTIDDETSTHGIIPDLLKIDVEGYELEVLRGARELLASRRPVVMLELHLDLLERSGIAPSAIVRELEQYGYEFFTNGGDRLRAHQVYDSVKAVLRCVAQ